MAGRHPADASRRPGLRLQVEHGLDARHARLHLPRADLPAVPPPRDDVLDGVRLLRELRAADLARRGGARQGLAAAARCPATGGSSWPPCARSTRTCGRTRASSCCSWARSSRRAPSGPRRDRWTGGCSTDPTTAACSGWSATSTGSTGRRRRCGRRTPTRPASTGSTPTTRRATSLVPALRRPTGRCWPASRTSRRCRTSATGSGCPGGTLGRGRQHRRRGLLRVRGRQPRRRRRRRPRRGTASPRRNLAGAAARGDLAALDRINRSGLFATAALLDRSRTGAMLGRCGEGNSSARPGVNPPFVADATFWRLTCPP